MEKFSALDKANGNSDVAGLARPELYVFYAQLNFEKLIQSTEIPAELEEAIENIKLVREWLEDHGTHTQKLLVDEYYGEGKFLLIKNRYKYGYDWITYSIEELERLEAIEKRIVDSRRGEMRIAAKRKQTDRPLKYRSKRRRIQKGLFRKRFLELQKTRNLRKRILEHRLKGCPGKETYSKYRLAVNDISLGKEKNTRKLLAALKGKTMPEFEELLLASSKERARVAEKVEEGMNKQICWLEEWETAFLTQARQRENAIVKFIHSFRPLQCGENNDRVDVSMIVAPNGRISNLKVGNTIEKAVERCVRKKIQSLRIPKAKTGRSIAVDFSIRLR